LGKKIKVVFDTNVWISISMKKILKNEFYRVKEDLTVYISQDIAREASRVLKYPRVAEVLKKANIREKDVLQVIADNSKLVDPKAKLHIVEEDEEDNKVLECALSTKADIIVSGDKHLLELGKFKNTTILKPREFLDSLSKET